MTYDSLFPFLKGFHLTLSSHLPNRNEAGWKIRELEGIAHLETTRETGKLTSNQIDHLAKATYDPLDHPTEVKPVPRFHSYLMALSKFFEERALGPP